VFPFLQHALLFEKNQGIILSAFSINLLWVNPA